MLVVFKLIDICINICIISEAVEFTFTGNLYNDGVRNKLSKLMEFTAVVVVIDFRVNVNKACFFACLFRD